MKKNISINSVADIVIYCHRVMTAMEQHVPYSSQKRTRKRTDPFIKVIQAVFIEPFLINPGKAKDKQFSLPEPRKTNNEHRNSRL